MSSTTTINQDEHDFMSWTACYDDDCLVHLLEKEGSGWFPRGKRSKQQQNSNGKMAIRHIIATENKKGEKELDAD
jgi:hypothetical protein